MKPKLTLTLAERRRHGGPERDRVDLNKIQAAASAQSLTALASAGQALDDDAQNAAARRSTASQPA